MRTTHATQWVGKENTSIYIDGFEPHYLFFFVLNKFLTYLETKYDYPQLKPTLLLYCIYIVLPPTLQQFLLFSVLFLRPFEIYGKKSPRSGTYDLR